MSTNDEYTRYGIHVHLVRGGGYDYHRKHSAETIEEAAVKWNRARADAWDANDRDLHDVLGTIRDYQDNVAVRVESSISASRLAELIANNEDEDDEDDSGDE